MIKRRLIATLLVHNGNVVQTRRFKRTNVVGSAFTAVDFFNSWAVDEIIVLDISFDPGHRERFLEIITELSRRCFVPLTVGGWIGDLDQTRAGIRAGADKVTVNTAAFNNPDLIGAIADSFGSQCVIVSIDAKVDPLMPSGYRVVVDRGRQETDGDALDWARRAVDAGAGELMVNEISHDGNRKGYDLALIAKVTGAVDAPVIAMGGVGKWEHLVDGVRIGNADAVAAGNIFHYTEHSTKKAKEFLEAAGLNVRRSTFYRVDLPRRPTYRPF